MLFNCAERITIADILQFPGLGNFLTFKTIRGLREKVEVTADEVKEFDLRLEGGMFHYNGEGMKGVEIELTGDEKNLINDFIRQISDRNMLNENAANIYEKLNATK